jgi:hypothetical protein
MTIAAYSSHVTIYIEGIGLNEVAPEGMLREGILPGLFCTFFCFFRLLSASVSVSLSLMEHRTDVQAFRMQL